MTMVTASALSAGTPIDCAEDENEERNKTGLIIDNSKMFCLWWCMVIPKIKLKKVIQPIDFAHQPMQGLHYNA